MVAIADLVPATGQVFSLPLAVITVPKDRLRSFKAADAAAFGVALEADGQYEPIAVTQLPGRDDFELVDGLHRLEGARGIGWTRIDVRLSSSNADERRRREILSEWVRAKSDVFDRAAQIAKTATIAMTDSLVVRPDAPREVADAATIAAALRWDDETAATLDISPRSVRNYLTISERFTADDASWLRLWGHADQLVPLLLLAKQAPAVLTKVLRWLAAAYAAERPVTIADAIASVTGAAKPTPEDKRFSAVIGNLGRMAAPERSAIVRRIVAQFLTDADLDAIVVQRTASRG